MESRTPPWACRTCSARLDCRVRDGSRRLTRRRRPTPPSPGQVWALALTGPISDVKQTQLQLARKPRRHDRRCVRRAAEFLEPPGCLGAARTPHRGRTERELPPRTRVARLRQPPHMRRSCSYGRSRCQARPALAGRLRRRSRSYACSAPDAPRQPSEAEPHRRDPPARPEGGRTRGLARRRGVRRRRPGARPRSQLGAGCLQPVSQATSREVPRGRTAAAAGQPAPSALLVTGRSTSSVTLRWTAPPDGASGYGVYLDGAFKLDVTAVSITLTGLACGHLYTFAVDAYGDQGRSTTISASASTDACPTAARSSGGSAGGGALAKRRRRRAVAVAAAADCSHRPHHWASSSVPRRSQASRWRGRPRPTTSASSATGCPETAAPSAPRSSHPSRSPDWPVGRPTCSLSTQQMLRETAPAKTSISAATSALHGRRRYDSPVRSGRAHEDGLDDDVDLRVVVCVDGQCRRHRLRPVPEQRRGRIKRVARRDLQRARLRLELHARSRRLRRSR